jgi:hypothetical protein
MKRYLQITLTIVSCLFTLSCSRSTAFAHSINYTDSAGQIFTQNQEGTPVPDSGYEGDEDDLPSLFDIFRRFIITETPTPTPGTPTPVITPTKTPKPTPTPIFVPPPSDPEYLRLMIALGFIIVIILVIGIWINRKHNT